MALDKNRDNHLPCIRHHHPVFHNIPMPITRGQPIGMRNILNITGDRRHRQAITAGTQRHTPPRIKLTRRRHPKQQLLLMLPRGIKEDRKTGLLQRGQEVQRVLLLLLPTTIILTTGLLLQGRIDIPTLLLDEMRFRV